MKALLAILLMFATASSFAADLLPLRHGPHLGVRIQGTSLPQSLRRDLTSGLTTRLLIRVTLQQAGRELHSRSVEIAIRYDLWDERFLATTRIDEASVEATEYQDVQQVVDKLRDINLPELFSTSSVSAERDLVMQAVVLINPVDRERLDAIRKWVADNSGKRSSLDPAGALGVGDLSLSNTLFNRIFEQYASGSNVASAWQQALTTKSFRLDRLSQ